VNESVGKVVLVGAGPGDPGLLTLRGAEALQSADVVFYDYLASPQLLKTAPRDVQLVCLGRHGQGRIYSQEEINERVVAEAKKGKFVVRLKGGDPAIFGHLAEELDMLETARIPYEVVPGISAACAASSYTGIPITHRDTASCVTFVTGQEQAGKEQNTELDYAALANTPGTLVFYMGVTTAAKWSQSLIEHGKSPETPIAIIRRCSLPDQTTFTGTLGDISERLWTENLRPPAIVIVGEVARHAPTQNWFSAQPLFGQTVLVTRPAAQASEMTTSLAALGAAIVCQPAIEIAPPDDWSSVDKAIQQLSTFDWIVFSSRNGVRYFLDRIEKLGQDSRALAGVQIAAIGPATVAQLANYALRADLCPEVHRAEALAEALLPNASGQKMLLVRASRGREVLAEMLTSGGVEVQQVVSYISRDVHTADPEVMDMLAQGKIDWVTVTSSAIARAIVHLYGSQLKQTQLAAISPLTADVLRSAGHEPDAVAETYTGAGLVKAITAVQPAPPK
jgi:uroporphyrinogen III methyltransferase/synthase